MDELYKSDFYSWTRQQADLIRQGRLGELDLDNILEELESMGRSEHRQLSHRLDVLLMHLLKWKYQPDHRSSSWRGSIEEQRFRVQKVLKNNPGLQPEVNVILVDAYHVSRISAFKETGLSKDTFPLECPWNYQEVIDDDFWPD